MTSLITSCCSNYSPSASNQCHQISPIFDIIGGVVLLIIGALIASGTINSGCSAMCGVFAGGTFMLGAGLSTFGQWHCANSAFKCYG